jgi:MFS family permease
MSSPSDSSFRPSVADTLLPIMLIVLVAFLVIGLALPTLPLYVNHDLGLGPFMVGLVTGSQFAASLFSRVWAGHYSDSRGPKRAVLIGLLAATISGFIYLGSMAVAGRPFISVSILLAGRALLGGAESFIITGALSWGLSLVNPNVSGKVIAWVGTAMYVAFALGAPAGTGLYSHFGFRSIAFATVLMPLATLLLVWPMRPVAPQHRSQTSISRVIGAVSLPGFALALSSLGFGSMTSFVTLLFVERGWQPAWLPFSLFAAAFILARLLLGHLPDRFGGARVACAFVLVESAGQALVWLAPQPSIALAGAALTGFGYSLVYPALGVEAVRRVPAHNRGLAMGAYTAFLDLALGVANPLLGLAAHWTGNLGTIFLIGAIVGVGCAVIAMLMRRGAIIVHTNS